MDWLLAGRWSPYAAGAGIGALCLASLVFLDKTLGASTAFARAGAAAEKIIFGKKILLKPYYQKFPPGIDYQVMLVAGIIAGSFISAASSGAFSFSWIPSFWEARAGGSVFIRWAASLTGGILLGAGSRWADGCTSGHGISGVMQLALSSWIASVCFFIGGIGAAMLIFKIILP